VKAGTFREDLFFRLRVVEIRLPGLRERREDVPLLAQSFLQEFAAENGKSVNSFTSEAVDLLTRHDWPGNVRELRTAIEHAVVLCRGERISARDLPPSVRTRPEEAAALPVAAPVAVVENTLSVLENEKQLIIRALKESDGNRTLAAEKLGMSRRSLHRKLHRFQLDDF
jgi:DNA-binding NtrC family response regulator